MSRKAFTRFGVDVGVSSGQLKLMKERIKEFLAADPDNRVEWQNVGVFHEASQQERFFMRGSTVYRVDARNIVKLRPPRRRNSSKSDWTTPRWCDVKFDNFPDEANPLKFRVISGVLQYSQPTTPHRGDSRNIVFTPIDDDAFRVEYTYDVPQVDVNGNTFYISARTSRVVTRFRSAWVTTNDSTVTGSEGNLLNVSHIHIVASNSYLAFTPFNWGMAQEFRNPDLGSKISTLARYTMGICRNDW